MHLNSTIIFILLCALSIDSNCSEVITYGPRQMTIIESSDDSFDRSSQPSTPLKITGQFLQSAKQSDSFKTIRQIFQISAFYYRRVLQVYPLSNQATKFRKSSRINPCTLKINPGTPFVSPKYITEGFNQNATNMVVYIGVKDNMESELIASPSGCQFQTRLVYGIITFNTQTQNGLFLTPLFLAQYSIYISLHQITHLLGFSSEFYGLFSESPTIYKKRPITSVVKNANNKAYIVTPNVMQYVSSYFNCNNTGGLLENQGEDAMMNHWESLVYKDQLMTIGLTLSGSKITKITLALLKDTNFYASVDDSLTDTVLYGKGKGCKFAQGDISQFTGQCSVKGPRISDYYSMAERYCARTPYSNKVAVQGTYFNYICKDDSITRDGMYFGWDSRCFSSGVNSIASCYKAVCNKNGTQITVTVDNTTAYCNKPGEPLTIEGRLVNCPNNFTVFCSIKPCPNYCSGNGICIDGECLCVKPFLGKACDEGCPVYFDENANTCVDKCPKDSKLMNKRCQKIS